MCKNKSGEILIGVAGAFPGVIPRNISDEIIVGIRDGIPLVVFGGNISKIMGKITGRIPALAPIRNPGGIFD